MEIRPCKTICYKLNDQKVPSVKQPKSGLDKYLCNDSNVI